MNGRSLSAFSLLLICASQVSAQDPAFNAKYIGDYDVPGDTYSDVWADGTNVYMGRFGLNVVDVLDVSTPSSISLTSQIIVPSPNNGCSAQDIKSGLSVVDPSVTLGFVAFDATGTDMFGIYDITNPASPTLMTRVQTSGLSTSHNTFYRSDGWIASCNSFSDNVAIFDLTSYDPSSPPSTITSSTYEITGLGSGFVHDITFNGDFLFVAEWDALIVYDCSDLSSGPPIYLGEVEGYSCHAMWPTADNEYIVTADERQGGAIRLWKMTDNGSSVTIKQVDSIVGPESGTYSTFSTHNPVVMGDRAYVSNYTAGVIVLQIDRSNDTWERVASYDTSTQASTTYDGCWGVYPFIGPELVVASDLQNGLITLDFSALQLRSTSPRPKTVTPWAPYAINIDIDELGTDVLDTATVDLYTSIEGAPFAATAMTLVGGTTWTADLPGIDCGLKVDYYFSASDMSGEAFTAPADATTHVYTAYSTLNLTPVFEDDFETNKGWSVTDDASLFSGSWERGFPNETGMVPGYDADGSGRCYTTEIGSGSSVSDFDVDGGPTTLTSPAMDFSAADGVVCFSAWQASGDGRADDGLRVEISDGGTWMQVDDLFRKAGGWIDYSFRVTDYVGLTSTVRVRFVISDNPNDSVTEACIDAFSATQFCQDPLATATFQNGSAVNTTCFTSAACVLDSSWTSIITHSGHPGATLTAMWLYENASSGTFGNGGERLVDLTSQKLLVNVKAVAGGSINLHTFFIPADVVFAGLSFTAQAGILGGGFELCNAYDYVIGF